MENSYQTVPLPDGTVIPGLFPTDEWYKVIAEQINGFSNKSILDLGCCQFSYGIQALQDGAKDVVGIDNDPIRIQQATTLIKRANYQQYAIAVEMSIEDLDLLEHEMIDIVLFSMVIHWMKDPEIHLKRFWQHTSEKLVLVYRYPIPNKEEVGWRPTVAELNDCIGQIATVSVFLKDTEEEKIQLVVYDKEV